MRVVSINVGVTKNLGDYESARVDLEASPDDTQTADELFQEMLAKVAEMIPQVTTKPDLTGESTPAKKSAPKKRATKKAAPKKAAPEKENEVKPQPAAASTPTLDDAKKAFAHVQNSGNLETLHARFNAFRSAKDGFRSVLDDKQWEKAINAVHKKYKELVDTGTDPEIVDAMSKAIVGERMALNNS